MQWRVLPEGKQKNQLAQKKFRMQWGLFPEENQKNQLAA
jgi:hypothetical protein